MPTARRRLNRRDPGRRIDQLCVPRHSRSYQVTHGDPSAPRAMIFIGLLSMGTAALFMMRQHDIKRLLAYSSVEHMGMMAFGIGIGGAAVPAALLHVIHNGICKAGLFLAVGNIHRAYGSKSTDEVRGVLRTLPLTGAMLLLGFFAITGSPPFGPFVSEYQMIAATFEQGQGWAGLLMIAFLLLVFLGMGNTLIGCAFGPCPERKEKFRFHDNLPMCGPVVLCMAITVVLGVYNPPFLTRMLKEATAALNVSPNSPDLNQQVVATPSHSPGYHPQADETVAKRRPSSVVMRKSDFSYQPLVLPFTPRVLRVSSQEPLHCSWQWSYRTRQLHYCYLHRC